MNKFWLKLFTLYFLEGVIGAIVIIVTFFVCDMKLAFMLLIALNTCLLVLTFYFIYKFMTIKPKLRVVSICDKIHECDVKLPKIKTIDFCKCVVGEPFYIRFTDGKKIRNTNIISVEKTEHGREIITEDFIWTLNNY